MGITSQAALTLRLHAATDIGISRHTNACATAFTLVELLVVVAIVAVLAGLLLPAAKMARSSSNQLKCQSNLKQIGMGLQVFASDSNGMLPAVWYAPFTTWGSQVSLAMEDNMYNGSTAKLGIWNCPENKWQGWRCNEGYYSEGCTSYGCNGFSTFGGGGTPGNGAYDGLYMGCPLSRLVNTTQLVAVIESVYYRSYQWWPDNGFGSIPQSPGVGRQYVRYAHHGRANLLFADGHVENRGLVANGGSDIKWWAQ